MQMGLLLKLYRLFDPLKAKLHNGFHKDTFPQPSHEDNSTTSLSERLELLSRELFEDSSGVEADFLKMGSELMRIYEEASALEGYAREMVTWLGGDGGVLNRIDSLVQESKTELIRCRDSLETDVACFAKGAIHMDALCGLGQQIGKMVLELRMIGLNIGIESVRSDEGRELFSHLASDVVALSKRIAGVAEAIQNDARAACDIQTRACRDIAGDIDEMKALASHAEAAVQEALKGIREIMSLSVATVDHAEQHSREISERVGRIVERIQFHDNMHQRILHITQALTETATAVLHEDHAPCHATLLLQTAQLKQIICEVEDARVKIAESFDEIARQLGALTENANVLTAGDLKDAAPGVGCEGKDLFSRLDAVLSRFSDIMNKGRGLQGRMMEIMSDATCSANKLSDANGQVRRINFEIRLMSLNAIIRTAHLGDEGHALEILAHAVKNLSDRSNQFAAQADELLAAILTTETGFTSIGDDRQIGDALQTREDIGVLEAYERLDTAFSEIARRSESLAQGVSGTRSDLSFLCDLQDRLNTRLQNLESCERLIASRFGTGEMAGSADTEHYKTRYTMDQERIIHERLISGTAQPIKEADAADVAPETPPPLDSPDTGSAENEWGDNVELF